ncbi:MAG TPA: YccF domain-containing protein [Alphaproteobacteria bacterium]|nr:YccF domain-containing protein [Alphaproteobacteria bacterium]
MVAASEGESVSLILNLIWFVFGGCLMGLAWWLGAILLAITIVGLPWASAAWRIGCFTFFPFGREAISKRELEGREAAITGIWRFLLNVVWFLLAGWYLVIGHLAAAILCGITIIGIPFAVQHLKLAGLSLAPVGTEIVPVELADEARRSNARASLARYRGASLQAEDETGHSSARGAWPEDRK